MKITKLKEFKRIDKYSNVKVCYAGPIAEVVHMDRQNIMPIMRKLDANRMVNIKTGEIIDCNRSEFRSETITGVIKTIGQLRRIINANVLIAENVRWVTFTYKENMTDTIKLKKDFNNFFKRFAYSCEKKGIQTPRYITVVEPQGRGAWHLHVFLIWSSKAPFIPNTELAEIWGQGFVTITAVRSDIDNLGAYFSAYLTNLPAEEILTNPEVYDSHGEIIECEVYEGTEKVMKKFKKGARLKLYPAGVNIYRTSRGIVLPEFENSSMQAVHEKIGSANPTFASCSLIEEETTDFRLTITKQYYNMNRKVK